MKKRWPHFAVLLLLAAMGSEIYLGDIDVGPFSPRVYLYALLIVWMLLMIVVRGARLPLSHLAVVLLLLYLVILGWSGVASNLQGGSALAFAGRLASYDAMALAGFFLMHFYVRTRRDLRWLTWGFVLLVSVSAVVAVLQSMNHPQAWAAWGRVRPHIELVPDRVGHVVTDGIVERLYPPGLYASSFTFGYYLAASAVLALAFFLAKRRILWLSVLSLLCGAAFVVQQRSAILAIVLTCGAMLLTQFQKGKRLQFFLTVTAAAVVLTVTINVVQAIRIEQGLTSYGRYERFFDAGRLQVASIALQFIAAHPVIGGQAAYTEFFASAASVGMEYETIVAPHNLFLNAAVLYGLPGLFLTCLFVAFLLYVLLQSWYVFYARRDLLGMACVLASGSYLLSAQFHNASFITGDSLGWWLVAFVLLARRFPAVRVVRRVAPARSVLSSPRPTAGPRLSQGAP